MTRRTSICLFLLLTFICSCGKIELPDPSSSTPDDKHPDHPESTTEETITVSQLLELDKEQNHEVHVKGYIVGYVDGTTLKQARFLCPENRANTNLLLADKPDEQETSRCTAVFLETGDNEFRTALNLYDHPDFFHRQIIIHGLSQAYFGQTGIRKMLDYHWPFESDSPEEIRKPDLSDKTEYIPEGR